ncbi:MAG: hypothetical protein JXA24_06290 [Proteobacteria bacterium]|nr:hypothetical protein [Pseudomonadota bacterium]
MQGISRRRIILAGACLIIACVCPLFIPLVLWLPIPEGPATVISGLLLFGIPELFTVAAIAIAGKEGYQLLKGRVLGLFKKVVAPPRVSRPRYIAGLVMFSLPLMLSLFISYSESLFAEYSRHRIAVNLTLDAVFVASFFVLGGEFWDKLRSLFVFRSRAVFEDVRRTR